jgi:pimeloyl-ACP methyl ester carboxylesterase
MQERFVEIPELNVHFVEQGAGPTVFLIHGWPQTSLGWRHIIPRLAGKFHVIAPDLRGFGDTSRPQSSRYDVGTLSADILNLADKLGIDQFSVVGHDWGGPVAFATALRARERVSKVGIVDVVIPGDGRAAGGNQGGMRWHHAFHRTPDLPEALVKDREAIYLKWFYDEYSSVPGAVPDDVLAQYAESYSKPGAMQSGFALYREFEQHVAFVSEELRRNGKLTCPVLGVGGGTGRGRGDEVRQSLVEVATNPICHVIEKSGHLVPEETPEALSAILEEFLLG